MSKLSAIKELVWQGDFRKLWGVGIVTGSMRWLEVLAIGIYTFMKKHQNVSLPQPATLSIAFETGVMREQSDLENIA